MSSYVPRLVDGELDAQVRRHVAQRFDQMRHPGRGNRIDGADAHIAGGDVYASALSGIDPAGGIQSAAGLGWTLENVSHVFIPTRERSRVLTDSAYVHGNVIGIYLFRRS